MGYEVLPDDEADRVKWLKKERLHVQEAVSKSPASPVVALLEEKLGCHASKPREPWDEAMAALTESLRQGVPQCWQELRAAEMLLEEVAEEFDGEDPVLPPVRRVLEETRTELEELVEKVQGRVGAFDLSEPDEEELARLRMIAKLATDA